MNDLVTDIHTYLKSYPLMFLMLKIIGILFLSWISFFIARNYLVNGLNRIFVKTKTNIDDALFDAGIFNKIAWILPLIVLYNFSDLFGSFSDILKRILIALIVLISIIVVGGLITAMQKILFRKDPEKQFQVKSSLQITRLILYVIGGVIFIAALLGQSPLVLLSGI